jgi:hypothetical protein
MPALKIYMSVMKWGGIQTISVPQIGLADGLVRIMYRAHTRFNSADAKIFEKADEALSGKDSPKCHSISWPGKT